MFSLNRLKKTVLDSYWSKFLPLNQLRSLKQRIGYNRWNREAFSDLYEHEKMLSDRVRVDSYAAGINALIQPGQVVVDLGTGNGILSLLAANRKASRVYAIDHSPFLDVAKKLAADNNCNSIEFFEKNSRDFNPGKNVDVILHEQMGDDLFSENMLENIMDLKRRVLKDGGQIIPALFDLYLEPVSLNDAYRVRRFHEHKIHGVDYSGFFNSEVSEKYRSPSYDRQFFPPSAFDTLLCKPEPLLSVDLNKLDSISSIKQQFHIRKDVLTDGHMDGLLVYFRCRFSEQIGFDTSPFSYHTHWGNRLLRTAASSVTTNNILDIKVDIGALNICNTWDYDVQVDSKKVKSLASIDV